MRLPVALVLAGVAISRGQDTPDPKTEAVAVVERLFQAMAARDAAAIRATLLPEAHLYAVRPEGNVAVTGREQFAARIAESKEELLERMWNPVALVSGRLATVWAEYDFHRGGKFSHCGVDALQLLKTAAEWKIASIAYTVRQGGCAPRPLPAAAAPPGARTDATAPAVSTGF